jgi:hypothetical protein
MLPGLAPAFILEGGIVSKRSWRRWGPVLVAAALALGNAGCGIIGWAVTPKSEVVHYTVPRLEEVHVRSIPDGAVVLVDGAEVGRTPKTVKVPVTEVRAQRRQSPVLGVVGLILDVGLFGAVTAIAIEENAVEATLISASTGLVLATLGGYLNFGKNTRNDSSDVLPAPVEIGIQYPGFEDQRRRIRVPDLQEVDFLLKPLPGAAPKVEPRPQGTPPDAPTQPAPADSAPPEQAPPSGGVPPTEERGRSPVGG